MADRALAMFKSYLNARSQMCVVNGSISSPQPINSHQLWGTTRISCRTPPVSFVH